MTTDNDVKRDMQNCPPNGQTPLIYKDYVGNCYANRSNPYWDTKPGNPYIPLDINGNKQKGYIG